MVLLPSVFESLSWQSVNLWLANMAESFGQCALCLVPGTSPRLVRVSALKCVNQLEHFRANLGNMCRSSIPQLPVSGTGLCTGAVSDRGISGRILPDFAVGTFMKTVSSLKFKSRLAFFNISRDCGGCKESLCLCVRVCREWKT